MIFPVENFFQLKKIKKLILQTLPENMLTKTGRRNLTYKIGLQQFYEIKKPKL